VDQVVKFEGSGKEALIFKGQKVRFFDFCSYTITYLIFFCSLLPSGLHTLSLSHPVANVSFGIDICVWNAHNVELHCKIRYERNELSLDFSPKYRRMLGVYLG
jgi:hypothetical protein